MAEKLNNMKVLFLDHDGVICLCNNWGSRRKKQAKGRFTMVNDLDMPVEFRFDNFDRKATNVLNEIIERTGCEIVVSSDWKRWANVDEMGEYYLNHGIIKKPISFTKNLSEIDVPADYLWSSKFELEQTRTIEILEYLKDHPEVTHWVAVDDLNMGIPQRHESWGEMNVDWGLTNFVLTPKGCEGIKQTGVKEKIIKFLSDGI